MGFKTTALLAASAVLLSSASAFAADFTFENNNPYNDSRGISAGTHKAIKTSFRESDDLFKWSATFERNNGVLADGAWLVANDGPNPKGHVFESAIYYLDEANSRVSIYAYDGQNNSNSWSQPGKFLDSTVLNVTTNGQDEKTFSFEYDATDLNKRTDLGTQWKGTAFEEKVGIWFHGVAGLDATYQTNADGKEELSKFSYTHQSWYDTTGEDTQAIPEPATTAALGLFAVAGAFVKRNKQSV